MSLDFEELDYRDTPLGALSLRRRLDPALGVDVFEVKLGDEFLMSSLFTEGEIALARLGLDGLAGPLDVLVGGLGLGYTAHAVLEHASVRSLLVVEALPEVIDWHCRGLVPLGRALCDDARCEFLHGDFYALAGSAAIDPRAPGRRFDAILVDIDHSPRFVLHESHGGFYSAAGLRHLRAHLAPGGVFALWSNDPPDEEFSALLGAVFARTASRVVAFRHPTQDRDDTNTIYVAQA